MEHTFKTEKGTEIKIEKSNDGLVNMYVNGKWVGIQGHEDGMFNIVLNGQKAKVPSCEEAVKIWESKEVKTSKPAKNAPCIYCGTYCHGDCRINKA